MSLLTLGGARVRQAWLLARFASLLVLATLVSTCELFTSPGEQQDIVVDFEGDTILVVGRAISTAVTVTIGGTEVLQPRLQFISSDTNVVVVRANGDSLFAKRRGEVDLTIQLVGSTLSENPPSATLRLYVYAAGIQVDQRSHVFNSLNESIIFVAEALDADGAVITGAPIVWASSDDAVASVEDNGRVTSRLNGTATLTAAVGGDVSSGGNPVSITVEIEVAQRLVRYSFEPATVRLEGLGAQVRVTLTPRDSGGSAIPSAEAPAASFESLDQTRATVDNTGLVTAIANGATKVRAFAVLVSDSVDVEVQQRAKTVLINGLDTRTITSVGDSTALSAVAIDSLGNVLTNPSISWVSRDIARIQVAPRPPTNVTLQSFSLGSAWVVASQDQGRDSVLVSISNDPVRLEVTPDTVRFENVGDLVQFTGTARNGIGTALPGQTVLWTVLDPTIVSIVGTGAATAEGVGSTRVIGRLTGTTIVDTAHITVNNLPSTVDLALQAVSLASVGDTSIPVVDIRNARGVALSRSSVRWETTGSQIATVSTDGIVVATGAGSAYIKAINPLNEARRDSLLLTVTNAPASVTLTPETFTITSLTRTQQYTATAFNARGSITTAVPMQFLSTRPQFATIDPVTGLATAVAVGLDTIIATAGGRADTAVLTIQNDAKDVVVSPPTAVVSSVGATFQLVAVARNDLGAQIPGVAFTWTSSDNNVATVTNTGLVEGVTVGLVTITATLGTLTASSNVTVANDPDVIDFALPSVTLASVGDNVLPAITLENAVGDPLARTSASWTTDNGLIATVSAAGNIVAVARGTTTIRATSPSNASRTDAITVVVTNAPVVVDVQPDNATLPSIGRTVALSLSAFNARGGLITGDGLVWQSLNPAIATVNSVGVVTARGIGSVQIVGTDTATGATTNDAATITVSNLTATAAIEPTSVSLTSIGQNRRIHVRARNELGNVIQLDTIQAGDPSGVVTWSVLPAGIVSITQDPVAQDTATLVALGTGSATVTALVDGVSVSIQVSVGDVPTLVDITSANFTLASLDNFQDVAINVRNALNVLLLPSAVTWSSSDPSVATVNSTGRVTAHARGTTIIRAESPTNALLGDQITVTVSNAPATVVLSNGDATLDTTLTAVGRTLNYIATVRNAAGALIPGDSVRWASSVPGVAGVAPTGRQAATVTALAAGGPAAITGQVIVGAFGGYAGTNLTSPTASQVTVANAATSLNLAPVVDTITNLGGTLQLTATALNDFGVVLPSTSVAFGFVGAAVTSVSATGLVTATNVAGSIGTAQVTASVNGGAITRTSFITVVNAPTVLNIIPVNRALASVGDTAFPAVTIQNAGGAALPRTAVVWSSTAPNVALVTETGEVSTVGEGTTTIRATSPFNPTITDAYTVTVTNDPASIVLNQTTAVALSALGRTFAFTGVVRNARGDALTGHSITWSRQTGTAVNAAIPDGVVTAAAIGTSTIRAAVTGFPAVLDDADVTVTNATVAINLNPASLTLTSLGQTQLVTATALNDLGAATGAAITWAPVTTVVTGVPGAPTAVSPTLTANQVGTVTVTATVGAVVAQLPVTVRNDVTNIDITTVGTQGAPLVIELAANNLLGVTLQNGLGGAIADRAAATWTSSNSAVASVTDQGLVSGTGVGTAIIRAVSPTNPNLPGRDSIFVSVPNTATQVTLDATAPADTFTAVGQSIGYTATVRNALGQVIPGAVVNWTSNNVAVGVPATPTSAATISALTVSTTAASATVTATSGTASGNATVVTVDPDTLFVDKDAAVTSRFGTRKRPYLRIEDALNAAASSAPDKVVFIRRGSTAYAETLALHFNVTLSGDSTAAGCANNTHCTTPINLPTLSHLSGAAAITLDPGTDVTIRHLAIRHAVDGPAIDATGARLTAEFVHVNPDPALPATPTGRGILIRNTTDSSLVRLSGINRVRTYGIRFDNATDGGAVDTVQVTDVDSLGGTDGRSGLHLLNSTRIHTAGNRFTQTGGAPTTMDGIRAAGSRAIAVGTDTFTNGRFSMRTSNGTVTTTGIRSINAVMAYYVGGTTDTLTATGDSVTNATGPCLTVFAGGSPADTIQVQDARGCNDTTDDTQVQLTIRLVDASGTPILGSFVTFTSDDPNDDLDGGGNNTVDLDTQAGGVVTVTVVMTAGALGQRVIRMESRGQAGDEDFGVVIFRVVKLP